MPSSSERPSAVDARPKSKQRVLGGTTFSSFADLVTLLHLQLSPLLTPEDANNLLASCNLLKPDVRDTIATKALLFLYNRDSVHFGLKCLGDPHQLIPDEIRGARGRCGCNWNTQGHFEVIPDELPLPKMLDARARLLDCMCMIYEGIRPHCFNVLQLFRVNGDLQFATMQPIAFSLVEALKEEQEESDEKKDAVKPIDTNNVDELSRLMDSLEIGMGSTFFNSSETSGVPTTTLEAHWRGIEVKDDGTVICQLCEGNAQFLTTSIRREHYDAMLRVHCASVYQPLKKFMTQHLKHVRYVKVSVSHPNECSDLLDLIAGFTSTGELCGVYVTDIGIPSSWISSRLAPGSMVQE